MEYRSDYFAFMQSFGAWLKRKGHWWEVRAGRREWSQADKKYFHSKIEPVLGKLCRKWQVYDLFSPTWTESEAPRGIFWPPTDENRDFHSLEAELLGFRWPGQQILRQGSRLVIQLDLNGLLSDQLNYAGEAIRSAFRDEMGKDSVAPSRRTRRRFAQYEDQLETWDLRQKGKKYREIAAIVFPDNLSTGLARVRDNLRAANRYIRGGYREIR
jgi:hypothetical protein